MRTKHYTEQFNVGRAKYVVNFTDGVNAHPDGSAFYDIRTFTNRKTKDAFVKGLETEGFTPKPYDPEGPCDCADPYPVIPHGSADAYCANCRRDYFPEPDPA